MIGRAFSVDDIVQVLSHFQHALLERVQGRQLVLHLPGDGRNGSVPDVPQQVFYAHLLRLLRTDLRRNVLERPPRRGTCLGRVLNSDVGLRAGGGGSINMQSLDYGESETCWREQKNPRPLKYSARTPDLSGNLKVILGIDVNDAETRVGGVP